MSRDKKSKSVCLVSMNVSINDNSSLSSGVLPIDLARNMEQIARRLDELYIAQATCNQGNVVIRRKLKKTRDELKDLMAFTFDVTPKMSKVLMQIIRLMSLTQTRIPADEVSDAETLLTKYLRN